MDKKKSSYKELLEEIRRLRERLTYDPITGLYWTHEEGRKLILLAIRDAHKKEKKVGLIRLDLNNLKSWNKKFGHEETDNLLGQLGQRLQKWSSEKGGIAMRPHFKGDEFGILIPSQDKSGVEKIIQELVGFSLRTSENESAVCHFSLGFAHENEPEVKEALEKLGTKDDFLADEGRLFTALNLIADSRERKDKSG